MQSLWLNDTLFGCTDNSEGGVLMIEYLNTFWTLLLLVMRGHLVPVQIYFYICNNKRNSIYILIIVPSTWGTEMITNPLLSSSFFTDKEEENTHALSLSCVSKTVEDL